MYRPPLLPSVKIGERGQSVSNPSPIFPEARGGLYTGYQKVLRFESYIGSTQILSSKLPVSLTKKQTSFSL